MVFLNCDRIEGADLREVHDLARATLRARRRGAQCRLLFASGELLGLIAFAGLDGVLKPATGFPPVSSADDLRRPGAAAA